MKKLRLLFLPLFLAVILVSCSNKSAPDPQPGSGDVSLYEARSWDGVKRAGIFYQIFVRSFADSDNDGIGDLTGITAKLDYLDDLGVSGIWLTPIYVSRSYHGYDVEDYKAINPEYGTMTDFEAMLAKAHSLDIRVILDFVPNHTSKYHPWFINACQSTSSPYRGYYLFSTDPQSDIASGLVPMTKRYDAQQWRNIPSGTTGYKYFGFFSDWMPDINYGPVETCETSPTFVELCDAAAFWLRKGVDGFRLDAVKHVYQDEHSDENPRFLEKFYDELRQYNTELYMIGEVFSEHDEAAPYYRGLPAVFDYSSWWRLSYAINEHHAKWYPKDLLEYRAEYAAVRPDYIQGTKLSNHDEDRTRTTLGNDIRKAKLAGVVLLTVSGAPYIYYGEEIGMLGSKATGDENVRDPMLWAPGGSDTYRPKWRTSSFSNDVSVGNVEKQSNDATSIYRLYKKFIELRNTYPALAWGEMKLLPGFNESDASDKYFMVFTRESGDERLLVVHNVSPLEKTYVFPVSIKTPIADFGGVKVNAAQTSATMPPYTTLICEL